MSRKTPKVKAGASPRPESRPEDRIEKASKFRWQRGCEPDTAPVERGGKHIQRVGSGLTQMRAAGTISDAEYAAALRWQRDAEPACEGPSNPEVRVSGSGSGPDAWMVSRVDGETRHREACRAVGVAGVRTLEAFVSRQLSIRSVAAKVAVMEAADWEAAGSVGRKPRGELANRRRITGELKAALEALAAHYGEVDRARRDAARRSRLAAQGPTVTAPAATRVDGQWRHA